jgi:peptidoglycan hydrolase CwlO-like protein
MLAQMRRLVGGAVAVACLFTTLTTLAAPSARAQQQQDLVESDPAVVRARADVEAAQLAAHEAADELEKATEQRDSTQSAIDDQVARVAELDAQRADLAAQREVLKVDLRARAISLYRAGGDMSQLDALMADSAVDAARRQQLGDIAARTTLRTSRKLEDIREQLATVQDTLRAEETDLRRQKASLDDLVAQQERLQAVMDQKVAEANAALARARVIGALHAAGEPIMGPSALTAAQLTAWFNAQGYHPRLEVDISELAQIFIDEGTDEGVRGDFAFAQSIVETAGFNAAPDNNYSGIGWCDSCSTGNRFPTPREGVRAQIQLLLNYADVGSRAANLHHPVSQYLYGSDPVAAARKFDTFFAKGWAPTWSDMGHGNWATAPNYASAVIGVYRRIVAFSQGG